MDIAYVAAGAADVGQVGLFAEAGEAFRNVAGDLWNNTVNYFQRKHMKRTYVKAFGRANDQGPPFDVLRGDKLVLGQYCEWTHSNHKYGQRYTTGRIDRLLNATVFKEVVKFQGIKGTNSAARYLTLSPDYQTTDKTKFPFYVFNLTALPFQGWDTSIQAKYATVPGYQLVKDGTLAPGTLQYSWDDVNGVNVDNTANERWQKESCTSDYHPIVDVYRHCWANISMLINAPTNCPGMKIHVALVKFIDNVGPRRRYYRSDNTTFYYHDGALTAKEMAVNDTFWESFLGHRLVHPIVSYGAVQKNRCIKFLKHIELKCDAPQLAAGSYHRLNLFYNNGRIYNPKMVGMSEVQGTASEGKMVKELIAGTHAGGSTPFQNPERYVQSSSERAGGLYDQPKTDTWLAVWCDRYELENSAADQANCSFDFNIRCKFEMPFTIGANAGGANQNAIMPDATVT